LIYKHALNLFINLKHSKQNNRRHEKRKGGAGMFQNLSSRTSDLTRARSQLHQLWPSPAAKGIVIASKKKGIRHHFTTLLRVTCEHAAAAQQQQYAYHAAQRRYREAAQQCIATSAARLRA
jgi:hypothetical protein